MATMRGAFCVLFSLYFIEADCLKLEQVFLMSRHNLRAPLGATLQAMTPLTLPTWTTKVGFLTPRGYLLEQYMGDYFREWIEHVELFKGDCPQREEVVIYTNTPQRTKETGKAFASSAFKHCNVTVVFKNTTEFDPIFHPILRKNDNDTFKDMYARAMQESLDSLHLRESLAVLDNIVMFNRSDYCKSGEFCDLLNTKDVILLEVGMEPEVFGPLSVGNLFVDFFLMSYYSDKPAGEIAWGKLTHEEQWQKLLEITRAYQDVRFNHTLSKDMVLDILHYMRDTLLLDKNAAQKFTMLVGHDSNLKALMAALEFKSFDLPGQYEMTPIGGKLVFQKWRSDNGELLLKMEFVYQTREQLKNAVKLSFRDKPKTVVLEMKGCPIDQRGFCPWTDFVKVMKNI